MVVQIKKYDIISEKGENNMNNKPKLEIAHGITDAITRIAMVSKDMFDDHIASEKVLNDSILPTVEAAYIFGVCNATTQLAVALMHANDDNRSTHLLPFKIDFVDAIKQYKKAKEKEKEEDNDEEYEQITIDDLLEMLNKKIKNKKPKKGE